jgi:hypothetical protein
MFRVCIEDIDLSFETDPHLAAENRRQAWYRNKLRAIFGSVKEHPVGSYTVFEATKRSSRYAAVA